MRISRLFLWWAPVAMACVVGAACGGGSADAGDDGDGSGDGDGDGGDDTPPPCRSEGFADAATSWSIPYPLDVLANGYHAVLDLDGDGLPDLVQYDNDGGPSDAGLGTDHWRLFRNTGTGFADAATSWSIPYPLDVLANGYHAVLDLDGDGLPDLVQHDNDGGPSDAGLGTDHWRLFRNTGTGFADAATSWSIPYPLDVLANGYHAVLDLDGDGLPDLVQHDNDGGPSDAGLGTDHWRLFRNTGTGFADAATSWSIPYPLDVLANGYHAVLDLDGDGLPDLVQHDNDGGPSDAGLGTDHWRLFRNTGTGFADAATSWSIPYPLDVLANGYHAVLDLDGDGLPDLVQHDNDGGPSDAGLGTDHWRLFRNTGTGFADAATSWSIPYPLDVLANGYHAVLDLDGDGLPDLVQHDNDGGPSDAGLGTDHWRLFAAVCP